MSLIKNLHVFEDLQDKYDVLKSEKEVLERQNTSLKGQRDALVNASNHTDGYEAGSSNDASYNELEDVSDHNWHFVLLFKIGRLK